MTAVATYRADRDPALGKAMENAREEALASIQTAQTAMRDELATTTTSRRICIATERIRPNWRLGSTIGIALCSCSRRPRSARCPPATRARSQGGKPFLSRARARTRGISTLVEPGSSARDLTSRRLPAAMARREWSVFLDGGGRIGLPLRPVVMVRRWCPASRRRDHPPPLPRDVAERNVPLYLRYGFELVVDETEPSSGIRTWGFHRAQAH